MNPRGLPALVGAALFVACGGDPPPAPGPTLDLFAPPSCAPNEAALRDERGEPRCLRAGAVTTAAAGEFPSAVGAMAPVVYVRAGAAGGDGSLTRPFGDVAAALDAGAATVLLSRGAHALAAPIALTRSIDLRGAGAGDGGTRLDAAAAGAITVRAPGGAPVTVTLGGLSIRGGAVGVDVADTGADVTLRDVAITGASLGLRVDGGASLRGEGVTVESASRRGVEATDGASITLRDARVTGGGGDGVWAERASVDLARVLVADNARDGVVLLGPTPDGGACADDLACAALPAAPARACLAGRSVRVHELAEVSVLRNGVTGVRAEAGAFVRAARILVADTRVPAGAVGGDGLYVAGGARVCVDPDVASDARRGRGSAFLRNARAGLLADGGSPLPAGRLGTRLDVAGALLGSNRGPGAFVQNGALADRLAFSTASDNAAIGVGATRGGRLALLLCDQMLYTRAGVLATAGAPVMLGDGLTLADADLGAEPTVLMQSELSNNSRFGLVAHQASLRATGSRGEGNGFGVGAYGGATVEGAATVLGRAPTPAVAAAFRGDLPAR
ncbi:MAG: right-handed parallel beta-helix repeat-containing protein [Polyangiales bacterium]